MIAAQRGPSIDAEFAEAVSLIVLPSPTCTVLRLLCKQATRLMPQAAAEAEMFERQAYHVSDVEENASTSTAHPPEPPSPAAVRADRVLQGLVRFCMR